MALNKVRPVSILEIIRSDFVLSDFQTPALEDLPTNTDHKYISYCLRGATQKFGEFK